jgi:hypothetical protein
VHEVVLLLVSARAPVPSARITHRLSPPARSLMKAIHLPSGEKRGWKSQGMPCVSALASPPSMGTVQRSPRASKRRVLPSGLTSTEDQVVSVVSIVTGSHVPGGALTSQLGFLSSFLASSSFFLAAPQRREAPSETASNTTSVPRSLIFCMELPPPCGKRGPSCPNGR